MWNITITQFNEIPVTDIKSAKLAVRDADVDIEIIEPGDWDGDWLAELPGDLEFQATNEGSFEITTPTCYTIRCDIDKEW